MGIVDGADRLKILQHITSMKGDLLTSGKASPTKRRRMSSTAGTTRCINGEGRWPVSGENGFRVSVGGDGQAAASRVSRNPSPTKYVNVLIRDSCPQTPDSVALSMGGDSQGVLSADSQGCLSVEQTSSESRDSSRTSSPDNGKIRYRDTPATASSHSIISSTGSRAELRSLSKLQSMATLRVHNVKRLSRSLNNLFPVRKHIPTFPFIPIYSALHTHTHLFFSFLFFKHTHIRTFLVEIGSELCSCSFFFSFFFFPSSQH